eukprot:CAMPEP_0202688046 /NCGR_PEP_ID=MMETSP1385-20130828/3586_1 /ASSEMBLY_ACC=CAM_ASM_000861 /TAXON_ID=933848 /ORGANISM="Elphidium margaritaceum" /LENGTH=152 /DNA_ID=CAMNT_0049342925 /DNA_START=111 /DNA_END=569 /DNA_ORIENTATION=+
MENTGACVSDGDVCGGPYIGNLSASEEVPVLKAACDASSSCIGFCTYGHRLLYKYSQASVSTYVALKTCGYGIVGPGVVDGTCLSDNQYLVCSGTCMSVQKIETVDGLANDTYSYCMSNGYCAGFTQYEDVPKGFIWRYVTEDTSCVGYFKF